jgi:hypothetical protein
MGQKDGYADAHQERDNGYHERGSCFAMAAKKVLRE